MSLAAPRRAQGLLKQSETAARQRLREEEAAHRGQRVSWRPIGEPGDVPCLHHVFTKFLPRFTKSAVTCYRARFFRAFIVLLQCVDYVFTKFLHGIFFAGGFQDIHVGSIGIV